MRRLHRAYDSSRVLLVCVAVAALSSSCAAAPQRPAINAALAQVRTAELDAAGSYYTITLSSTGDEWRAGKLDDAALARVKQAGDVLYRALTIAHSEHKLYLAGGNNLLTYDAAFADMKTKRTNLELVYEAAHR